MIFSVFQKNLDIQIQEVGAKRRLNSTSKVNTHTHTQTHKHMDISRCWENLWHPFFQHRFKNAAYGRQSISRPMRIVAPIPQ